LTQARELPMCQTTDQTTQSETHEADSTDSGTCHEPATYVALDCGPAMLIIETFPGGQPCRSIPKSHNSNPHSTTARYEQVASTRRLLPQAS